MARDIDYSQPLDADDVEYLRARSWLVDEAALQGFDIRDQVENGASEDREEEEYDAEQDVNPAPQTQEEEEEEEDDEEVSYEDATVADLQAELKSRDLPTSGNKSELIARLVADDESEEEEEV